LLGFKVNYTYNGDDQPLLKVKDGDGNEVDESRIKIFNTTQDSKNQREAKCLWVQPQTGTASETVTVGFHFPNATGVEDFTFDEVVVTDHSVTVVESSEEIINDYRVSIENNGVSTVVSESLPGTFSVNRTNVGRTTITLTGLDLTVSPSVRATLSNNTLTAVSVRFQIINLTTIDVETYNSSGSFVEADYHLEVSRQFSDVNSHWYL